MEASMRAQRAKINGLKIGGADTNDIMIQKCRYQAQLQEYADFAKKMGLKEHRERIYIDGLGNVITGRGARINTLKGGKTVKISRKPVENHGKGGKIKSKHMEKRAKERGISEVDIEDAKQKPLYKGEVIIDELGRKSVKYIGTNATVIVNPDTNVEITSWRTGKRVRKKYRRGN